MQSERPSEADRACCRRSVGCRLPNAPVQHSRKAVGLQILLEDSSYVYVFIASGEEQFEEMHGMGKVGGPSCRVKHRKSKYVQICGVISNVNGQRGVVGVGKD